MTDEAKQHIRSVSQSSEAAINLRTKLSDGDRIGVTQALLDVAVDLLLGIEIRRVGRQLFVVDVRFVSQVSFDDGRGVRPQPIPHDDDRPSTMASKMTQSLDDLLATDRAAEVAFVDLARQRQAHEGRHLAAAALAPQQWCSADRCPRRGQPRQEPEAHLVDEHDHCAEPASLFLILGQSRSSHAWTRSSSRSRARGAGICGLHPKARSLRLRYPGWYWTPYSASMRSRTLGSVQRSVSKPWASAP